MYLFKKNNDKSISVYSFVPNSDELIKFKEKHRNNISSVDVRVANQNTQDIILNSPSIMFDALDRREDTGEITSITKTDNPKLISRYIYGEFDSLFPLSIIGGAPTGESRYCGEIMDVDSTLLYQYAGYSRNTLIISNAILLTGILDTVQPLLTDDINNLLHPYILNFSKQDLDEFFQLCTCTKEKVISLDNLRFLQEAGLINFADGIEETFDRSFEVLNAYQKARRRKK